jgi:hypothetical protein
MFKISKKNFKKFLKVIIENSFSHTDGSKYEKGIATIYRPRIAHFRIICILAMGLLISLAMIPGRKETIGAHQVGLAEREVSKNPPVL